GRLLAVLLLIGLLDNWRIPIWALRVQDPVGLLVGVTWLALLVASVVGLWRVQRRGAYSLLVLAPFSTVLLATPLLPAMHLVGLKGPLALALWNLVALVGAVVALRAADHPERRDAGSLTSA